MIEMEIMALVGLCVSCAYLGAMIVILIWLLNI